MASVEFSSRYDVDTVSTHNRGVSDECVFVHVVMISFQVTMTRPRSRGQNDLEDDVVSGDPFHFINIFVSIFSYF